MRPIDYLYSLAFFYNSSGSCLLEDLIFYLSCILYCDTKSCGTAIHITDIALSTKTFCNHSTDRICSCSCISFFTAFFSCIDICFCIQLCRCIIVFTSRCLKIKFFDQERKNHIIQNKVNNSHRNHPHPACLLISLQNTKQEEIQKSTGECQSYCDIQHMRDHISRTCQYNLNRK